jgi:molybdopterin-guanine dinucleotide biosynthesis protein A
LSESVSGVILAGGRGSRLGGINKALLEINGWTNLARVTLALNQLCGELIAVTNDDSLDSIRYLRVVRDEQPHAGVLPALQQGLDAASSDLAIVVACDMPFLNGRLLTELVQRAPGVDVVMPIIDGRPEPMHAVYRRVSCLSAVRMALACGEQRMISFLSRVEVAEVQETELRQIDRELLSFFNTNTPEDLERAAELAQSQC